MKLEPARPYERMCCRRMLLGYVDLVTDNIQFGNKDMVLAPGVLFKRHSPHIRVVSCD
jgi:hypothetical protein